MPLSQATDPVTGLPVYTLEEAANAVATDSWLGMWTYADLGDGILHVDVSYIHEGYTPTDREDSIQVIRNSLEVWSYATGLEFMVHDGDWNGEVDITFDTVRGLNAFTQADYVRSGADAGLMQNIGIAIGDTWFNELGYNADSYGASTVTHEIGHALGLNHPGRYNGTASYEVNAEFANDSNALSIMSYFHGDSPYEGLENTFVDSTYFEAQTPMPADILAIEMIYGDAIGGRQEGDTIHGVNSTVSGHVGDIQRAFTGTLEDTSEFFAPYIPDGTVFADGSYVEGGRIAAADNSAYIADVEPEALPMAWTVVDDSGHDTLDFSTDTQDQVVEFFGGGQLDVYGGRENVAIALGTEIEVYLAGSGNDTVLAGATAVEIHGNAGNDTLTGGTASDLLDGGTGDDRLDGGGNAGHVFSLLSGQQDLLDSFFGTAAEDMIDTLDVSSDRSEYDVLVGASGADVFVFRDVTRVEGFDPDEDFIEIDMSLYVDVAGEMSAREFIDDFVDIGAESATITLAGGEMELLGTFGDTMLEDAFVFV